MVHANAPLAHPNEIHQPRHLVGSLVLWSGKSGAQIARTNLQKSLFKRTSPPPYAHSRRRAGMASRPPRVWVQRDVSVEKLFRSDIAARLLDYGGSLKGPRVCIDARFKQFDCWRAFSVSVNDSVDPPLLLKTKLRDLRDGVFSTFPES